jgi:hypothetical protein
MSKNHEVNLFPLGQMLIIFLGFKNQCDYSDGDNGSIFNKSALF